MNYYNRITSLLLGEARRATPEAVERAKRHHAARRAAKELPINAGDNLPPPRSLPEREKQRREIDDALFNYTKQQRQRAQQKK